jgi:hypothetical protein
MSSVYPYVLSSAKVLVYLEHRPMAERLANLLAASDIEATLVHCAEDFDRMAALIDFDVVVTSTRMIGNVCLKLRLPIVNVEKFVFTVIDEGATTQAAKRFDAQKFVAEIFEARDFQSSRQTFVSEGLATQQGRAL